MLTVYGEEVIPLSQLVKELCLKQGNLKQTSIFKQLVYARWAWKELFKKNIWSTKNVVLKVDCTKHTITIPEDCERIINISVKDCFGKIQPLTCDPNLSTVQMDCVTPNCTCTRCEGRGTLCGAIDSVAYTTEMVEIQGEEYEMQIWTRYDGNGAIQTEKRIPTLDSTNNTIVYTQEIRTVCNVEVSSTGCVLATASNMDLLRTWCGCGNFPDDQTGIPYNRYWTSKNLIPQPYNYFGYWNVNAEDKSIIHIYRYESGLNWWGEVNGVQNGIYQVILSYQTNGETSGEEILVPQYAQEAMDMGIIWQQFRYNNRSSRHDKQFAKEQWDGARVKVNKWLNPIRLEVMTKLQTELQRW